MQFGLNRLSNYTIGVRFSHYFCQFIFGKEYTHFAARSL